MKQPTDPSSHAHPAQQSLGFEDGFDLWGAWAIFKRRNRAIASGVVVVVAIGALYTALVTPTFTASTTLLIESLPTVIDTGAPVGNDGSSEFEVYLNTQFEILESASLAAQVIGNERLGENPVFSGVQLTGRGDRLKAWLRGSKPSETELPASNAKLIRSYAGKLLVELKSKTRIIKITFSTPDPDLSAQMANAHARAYIQQGIQIRSTATEDGRRVLEAELSAKESEAEASAAALNRYRREKGILSVDNRENVVSERLAELGGRVTAAAADTAAIRAQFELSKTRDHNSLPVVINNAVIQSLKGNIAELKREYDHLRTQLPASVTAPMQAQLKDLRKQLDSEIKIIVAGIKSEYLLAKAQEADLRESFGAAKQAALDLKDVAVEYDRLSERKLADAGSLQKIRLRIEDLDVAGQVITSNVRVIDEAVAPGNYSRPRVHLNMAIAVVLGILAGLGLGLVIESLDKTLKNTRDVERYLNVPVLGLVPDFRSSMSRLDRIKRLVSSNSRASSGVLPASPDGGELVSANEPGSVVAEAYRSIRARLLISQAGEAPRVILFTSAIQGEGKTTTMLNTAAMFAQLGSPVAVVDADLRRPRCHKILGIRNEMGLTEVLTGQTAAVPEIRVFDSPLFFLPSGVTPPNPSELFGSTKMKETIASLRERYAYVLIDSPPLSSVSDALVLTGLVDGVVLVVDQQRTPREMIRESCEKLSHVNGKVFGVVLNRASPQANPYGEHAYTSYGFEAGA